ncbi:MAG: hypothetical protein LBR87_02245 [Synergistaceae bacterium]|jgi:ABC-type tungstate transport system permease subunit|nr:hypothetical protein [Synergistaceae bacterium]
MKKSAYLLLCVSVAAAVLNCRAAGGADLSGQGPLRRVRIVECLNAPAAQMLLLQLDIRLRDMGPDEPAWRSLPSKTAGDREKLEDVFEIGVYDMIFTSDMDYANRLKERGIVRSVTPVWKERVILAGPESASAWTQGMSAAEIMKKAHGDEEYFFSLLTDGSSLAAESALWEDAGVSYPGDNKRYVETGRDPVTALMQAGDERGFILVGESSFAQYTEAERFEPPLAKLADTEYFRVTAVCMAENSGFRKYRTEQAEKYLEWCRGPEAKEIISSFSIAGVSPFSPAERRERSESGP